MLYIYLLNINQILNSDNIEELDELILSKVDDSRRAKINKSKNPVVKAMAQGAGLLLMYAAKKAAEKAIKQAAEDTAKNAAKDVEKDVFVSHEAATLPILTFLDLSEVISSISEPISLDYCYGEEGKPCWKDESLPKFNLSHSGDYVALAISESEVGIDIQKCKSKKQTELADRFFSDNEKDVIHSLKEEEMNHYFFKLWSRKEAFGKCTGQGVRPVLDMDFSDLSSDSFSQYSWYEDEFEDYVIAAVSLN